VDKVLQVIKLKGCRWHRESTQKRHEHWATWVHQR